MPTETITFPSGSTQLQAYIARPDGSGPFPALVLIHEVYGLNEDMQRVARLYAEQGYAAMAVNLYYGRNQFMCMMRYFMGMFANALKHSGILDLHAALDWLAAQPYVDRQRVGAAGFCMGGAFVVAWACTDQRLRVIAPYYGATNPPAEALARSCPVVGSWPDPDFSTRAGKQLDAILDTHNVEHEIKIYPGATHSFFNGRLAENPTNIAAAADSLQRTLAFFKAHGL